MSNHTSPGRPAALDELTDQLLACGAVLSQIISHMVQTETAGLSAPDAAPIPETAHMLIRDVLGDVRRRYTSKQIRSASQIVELATAEIAENIFLVSPELMRAHLN